MDPNALRFSFDDLSLYGWNPVDLGSLRRLHSFAMTQNMRVSERVLPKVHDAVLRATSRLGQSEPPATFVYASSEANASCMSNGRQRPIMMLSSAVISRLTPPEWGFVIGHEIGHHVLHHHRYPAIDEQSPDLRTIELRRSAEISADRCGRIACGDLETALHAMLKIASGLDTEVLEVDLHDFVHQHIEAREMAGDDSLPYASHPSFPLRARALLQFDSVYQRHTSGEDISQPLQQLDKRIHREMSETMLGDSAVGLTQAVTANAFWLVAFSLCSSGRFSTHDQRKMQQHFPAEKVESLKRMLANACSADEALLFLRTKRDEGFLSLQSLPLFARPYLHELLSPFMDTTTFYWSLGPKS